MKTPARKRVMGAGLGLLACGGLALWQGGAAPHATTGVPAAPLESGLWQLSLRTGAALAGVVALILGAAALARRYGVSPARRAAGALQIVERLDLAPKRALYSVRAGGRVVLVGVTESAITPVLEWSAEESARLYPPSTTAPAPPFASLLQSVVGKAKSA